MINIPVINVLILVLNKYAKIIMLLFIIRARLLTHPVCQ